MNYGLAEISLIISVLAMISTAILSYLTYRNSCKQKEYDTLKNKYQNRINELITLYQDVNSLINIQDNLCQQANVSKIKARQGYIISDYCGPKHIEKRIKQLKEQLGKL